MRGAKVEELTVLAQVINRDHIRMWEVSAAMRCSHRELYNYMHGIRPVRTIRLGPLCDLLNMDPEELVDERGFLLKSGDG